MLPRLTLRELLAAPGLEPTAGILCLLDPSLELIALTLERRRALLRGARACRLCLELLARMREALLPVPKLVVEGRQARLCLDERGLERLDLAGAFQLQLLALLRLPRLQLLELAVALRAQLLELAGVFRPQLLELAGAIRARRLAALELLGSRSLPIGCLTPGVLDGLASQREFGRGVIARLRQREIGLRKLLAGVFQLRIALVQLIAAGLHYALEPRECVGLELELRLELALARPRRALLGLEVIDPCERLRVRSVELARRSSASARRSRSAL